MDGNTLKRHIQLDYTNTVFWEGGGGLGDVCAEGRGAALGGLMIKRVHIYVRQELFLKT